KIPFDLLPGDARTAVPVRDTTYGHPKSSSFSAPCDRLIMRRIPVEAVLPLALSTVAVVGVLPFAVIRFANADWLMASLDTAIIAGFTFLGVSVLRPRRVRFASLSIAI